MEYENPEIPEGINVTPTHPLKEVAQLVLSATVFLVLIMMILALLVERLVVFIPFAMEQDIARVIPVSPGETGEIQEYLQELAGRLSREMSLPEDMTITVHYSDDDIRNAFAGPGGHIFIHRALLDGLRSENALAMVIAHEIGHVQHRDPLIGMGRGVVIGLLILSLSGVDAGSIAADLAGNAGTMTMLQFSRDQERRADAIGLAAVAALYGHVNGADELFRVLLQEHDAYDRVPAFLRTHPLDADRLAAIDELARHHGWKEEGDLTPLPEGLGNTGQVP